VVDGLQQGNSHDVQDDEGKRGYMMVNLRKRGWRRGFLLELMIVLVMAGCASFNGSGKSVTVSEVVPGFLAGYLSTITTAIKDMK
jgi:hypothetical protein